MVDLLEGRHWILRQNDDPLPLHREHAALYEAIASGDADAAARASVDHVRTSRELCFGLLYPADRTGNILRPRLVPNRPSTATSGLWRGRKPQKDY